MNKFKNALMKRISLFFALVFGFQFANAQPPTITSFTPISARPGDVVTLTGTNFNTTAANNIVFFGATRATVSAATATSATVTVPVGATYAPITLLNTVNRLAAYSLNNFTPKFNPAKTGITAADFAGMVDFETSSTSNCVAIGDLDGDGKPDLAVANDDSATVSVFRNTATTGSIGQGSFAARVDFATGNTPTSIAIGDLDGDGKPDLAVTNSGSATVSVLRNTATIGSISTGSFAAKLDFATGNSPTSIAIVELDGDGKPDLAIGHGFTISILRNTATNGNVSFASKVDFAIGEFAGQIAIGDLDADGKPDLAGNWGDSVFVLRNTATSGTISTSSFAAKIGFNTANSPRSVAIGDLDGDGKPDLSVVGGTVGEGSDGNTISLLRNTTTTGSIAFAAEVKYAAGQVGEDVENVVLGDLDGDGKPDLAVLSGNTLSSYVSILRNASTIGNLTFAAKVDFNTGGPNSIAIGDLDGDGKPDLATLNNAYQESSYYPVADYKHTVALLHNTVIVAPAPPTITSFTPNSARPGDVVTLTGTNFNTTPANNIVFFGATRAPVTASTATSATLTVPAGATYAPITLLNTGTSLAAYSRRNFTPKFSPAKTGITATGFATKVDFATGTNPYSVAIGDLDSDGKPDLAIANYNSNTVSVYRNTATIGSIAPGSFAAKADFATGAKPYAVSIGDLDGDGKPDLAVANSGSTNVSIFRNTATSGSITASSFAAKVDFATGAGPWSVAIGDLDGDGKPDLAVANNNVHTVSVLRNTATSGSISTGSFAAKVDFATGASPNLVALGDLDADGKPDLVIGYVSANNVSVFRNTATSGITKTSFAAKVNFATDGSPSSVAIGDLDGDGKADLAVTNADANTVSVYRNTTTSGSIHTGSFAAKVEFATGTNPFSVAIGDVDGDGKADLAVTNFDANTVSVFRNTATPGRITTGSFAAKVNFGTAFFPNSVAIGDLDADGKADLAVTNFYSGTVSVLRNTQ